MSNYFLGFFPDEKSNHKIRKVVGEVGRVFDGQGINVRWTNPKNFHVTLVFLGSDLNIFQRYLINYNLKNLVIPKFSISFDKCELGIGRNNRDLLYMSVKSGGGNLRNLVYSLRKRVISKDFPNKIHHLTLGRVLKDLGSEEYQNLVSDLKNIRVRLDLSEITISSENLWLVKSSNDNYEFLKKFETA
jgi:2'-5' RNA ligase